MFVCKDQNEVELIMMAGNPSWWSVDSNLRSSATIAASDHHHHHNHHHHNNHQEVAPNLLMISQTHPNSSLNLAEVQYLHDHHHQHAHDFPHSWSQLLLGGLGSDHQQEERFGPSLFQSTRVMNHSVVDVKQEVNSQTANNTTNNNLYGYNHHHHEEQETAEISNRPPPAAAAPWSHSTLPASSPKSCVTSLSSTNNILDFSTSKRSLQAGSRQHVDHSNSECNSTANGGASNKKPRVQSSSNPPLKVRKEKLGERITALHQLVSPFGKTDTASVLLEAIGYIRFLQGQIEVLSSPYLGGNNASAKHPHAEERDAAKDLKSRGLCLVPISCTQLVGSDNGADYWAPSLGGGF